MQLSLWFGPLGLIVSLAVSWATSIEAKKKGKSAVWGLLPLVLFVLASVVVAVLAWQPEHRFWGRISGTGLGVILAFSVWKLLQIAPSSRQG